MAAAMTYDAALEMVKSLDSSDQKRMVQDLLKHLLGKTPRKGGSAKSGAAGGTGGSGSWWTVATKKASAVLAPLREAENAKLSAAGKKKLPGTIATTLLSKLKEAGKVTKEGSFPSDEELQEAFASYIEDYEPEDAKSTASKGSKASSGPKFSELSPEEQKARRSEAAKKAAASRKANKAAKEAAGSADEDEDEDEAPAAKSNAVGGGPADAAEAEEETTFKERTIGKRKCLVMEIGSLTHVCDMEQNWLGVLKGTKIVKEGYSSPFEGDD